MPFEPRPREVRLHLDRWLVLGDNREQARKWLMRTFRIMSLFRQSDVGDSWTVVSPWFDPVDVFEVRICTDDSSIYGQQFYNFVDIRSKLAVLHDSVKQISTLGMIKYQMRIHPDGPRAQHPHPEPEGEERDRLDLRRRWIAPDPFPDPRVHDQHGAPDGPEWLVSPLGLRRRG